MDTIDKIDKFKYRYIIVNVNQYVRLYNKHKEKIIYYKPPPYSSSYCILDWKKGNVMAFSDTSMKKKTFPLYTGGRKGIDKYDLSFLNPYKTDDKSIFLQSDKVKPNAERIDQLYAIDHIWLAYVYRTKPGTVRMCLNSNIFGEFKDIGSREMNLNEILLSL